MFISTSVMPVLILFAFLASAFMSTFAIPIPNLSIFCGSTVPMLGLFALSISTIHYKFQLSAFTLSKKLINLVLYLIWLYYLLYPPLHH